MNPNPDETAALKAALAQAHTTMRAAAEELRRCWDAHCDADGHGPVNLERRLREPVADCYGYCKHAERLRGALNWERYSEGLQRGRDNRRELRSKPASDTDNLAWLLGYHAGWHEQDG